MNITAIAHAVEWIFLGYFVAISFAYFLQSILGTFSLRRYVSFADATESNPLHAPVDLPISIIIPAYNESASIVMSIRALLQLEYPDFELIVVNDGSKDDTLEKMISAFHLVPFPEAVRDLLPSQPIRGVYRSTRYRNMRVVDKENGGCKADAINAGINVCRYPLVCVVDADGVLQRNALARVARPFLLDPKTVAAGGTVRIANGCKLHGGFLEEAGLPSRYLPLIQVIEYLRAFLFGRMGWEPIGSVMIISGAFGVFRRDVLIEVGGFNTSALGEDMELILRIHRRMKLARRPYRIAFVPDPICWTDAPENLKDLASQRTRWQHGLGQALFMNKQLFLNPRGGTVSWIGMPFYFLFELIGPIVELAGLVFMIAAACFGVLAWPETLVFLVFAISIGLLLSVTAIMLEEYSFPTYRRKRDLAILYGAALIENFGYRQLTLWWRLKGLARWLSGRKAPWESLSRSTSMSSEQPPR